jgi:N-acetylglutamate synthase/N-acetylornithine aminotransferase
MYMVSTGLIQGFFKQNGYKEVQRPLSSPILNPKAMSDFLPFFIITDAHPEVGCLNAEKQAKFHVIIAGMKKGDGEIFPTHACVIQPATLRHVRRIIHSPTLTKGARGIFE